MPHFQLMWLDTLRRDSPFFVHIPPKIRHERYDHVNRSRIDEWMDYCIDNNLCRDIDETAIWMISTWHMKSIVEWWTENNEKEEIELDIDN